MTAANPTLASEDLPRDELLEQSKFRVRSACGPIDAVLAGGLASASVTCISGDRDDAGAKSTLAAHFLASHLLSAPAARAAVVHAGGFDVARLHQLLVARIERRREGGHLAEEEAETEEALERLMVSRVFSFEGVVEAVAEARRGGAAEPAVRVEIPDSDDDDDGDALEEQGRVGLVVVDDFAAAVQMSRAGGFLASQDSLLSLLRSLAGLARARNVAVVVVYAAGSSSSMANQRRGAPPLEGGEFLSAFGCSPAFSASDPVAYGADLHLLVSPAPREQGEGGCGACVLEVVSDRREGRVGRWCEFAMDGRFQLTV